MPVVIAIDGPAASGKSSTAGRVAAELGMVHLDTGALYRAMTWLALDAGLDDPQTLIAGADEAGLHLTLRGGELVVVAGDDERDITSLIRAEPVTRHVSVVAAMPPVRDWVNRRFRVAARSVGGAVLDGRDIGTVVFPDAALKVFLTATPEARARRRLLQQGTDLTDGAVALEAARLAERDRLDAARAVAPLRQADDAILVDTTSLALDDQVARIVALARERGLPR